MQSICFLSNILEMISVADRCHHIRNGQIVIVEWKYILDMGDVSDQYKQFSDHASSRIQFPAVFGSAFQQ